LDNNNEQTKAVAEEKIEVVQEENTSYRSQEEEKPVEETKPLEKPETQKDGLRGI
jgi:hypothetical protein